MKYLFQNYFFIPENAVFPKIKHKFKESQSIHIVQLHIQFYYTDISIHSHITLHYIYPGSLQQTISKFNSIVYLCYTRE